jgi:hypothetical protein
MFWFVCSHSSHDSRSNFRFIPSERQQKKKRKEEVYLRRGPADDPAAGHGKRRGLVKKN